MSEKYPEVKDHSTRFLFPFYFPTESNLWVKQRLINTVKSLKIMDIIEKLHLPSSLYERIRSKQGQYLERNVWLQTGEQGRDIPLSEDFHKHLKNIIKAAYWKEDSACSFMGHVPFKLNSDFINILSGELGQLGDGLEMPITKSAADRLGINENYKIPFWIEDIHLYLFGAGVGIVVLKASYQRPGVNQQQPQPDIIIEGNYICYRTGNYAGKLYWCNASNPSKDEFTLEGLVLALIPGLREESDNVVPSNSITYQWKRLFTYTSVHFSEPISDIGIRNKLAYRLAHKYTNAYLPAETCITQGLLSTFTHILHGVALEGGVVISEVSKDENGNTIQFLENFHNYAVPKDYFPLALVAYQEYLALIRLIPDKVISIEADMPSHGTVDKLKSLQNRFLRFRLNFRFSAVSLISMHNEVYNAWRKAFDLDKMLEEVTHDVKEAEAYLDAELERTYSVKQELTDKLQTSIGIFIGAMVFLTGIFGMNIIDIQETHIIDILKPSSWKGLVSYTILSLGLGFAVWFGVDAFVNRRK